MARLALTAAVDAVTCRRSAPKGSTLRSNIGGRRAAGLEPAMNTVKKRLSDVPFTRSVMATNRGDTYYQRLYERDVDGVQGPWECVDYMTIPVGTQFGRHIHDGSEELYVLLKGRGTALLDDEEHPVGPGDYLMLRNGGMHGLRNDGDEPIELLCVCIYLGSSHRLIPVWD
jgi:mannose-6-phosphate isomerase-like protein (cupin superfamily)